MIWGKIWSWTMKYLVYDTWCLIIFCWKYKKIDYSNAECHHHNLECYHLQISIWNITNIYFNPLHIEHIHIHVYTVFQPFGYNITFSTLSTNILAQHDGIKHTCQNDRWFTINTVWLSNRISHHGASYTSAQVMACHLFNVNLNHCSLIVIWTIRTNLIAISATSQNLSFFCFSF